MNKNCQEWYNTISKDEIERTALRMQDEECLNSSKQNMCWAPCLFLSIAWLILTSREILKNNWRMKRILDEPPCRASMKNSGNKRMIKRKRSWKHKVKPCNDLDGASRRDNAENLELRKKNRWNTRTENYFIMNNLRKKRIESPRGNKNKIYCMLILHQIKLMTSNGFGILLILVERIKIDIGQTWDGLQRSTGRIETTNKLIW